MIKHGVDLRGLTPIWGIAFPLILDVYRRHGQTCRITSATDGVHGARSLHPAGSLECQNAIASEPVPSKAPSALTAGQWRQFEYAWWTWKNRKDDLCR